MYKVYKFRLYPNKEQESIKNYISKDSIYYANNCSINLFHMLFLKKEVKFNEIMKRYFKIFGLCLGGFLISSLVETFFSPFFIKIFTFLVN